LPPPVTEYVMGSRKDKDSVSAKLSALFAKEGDVVPKFWEEPDRTPKRLRPTQLQWSMQKVCPNCGSDNAIDGAVGTPRPVDAIVCPDCKRSTYPDGTFDTHYNAEDEDSVGLTSDEVQVKESGFWDDPNTDQGSMVFCPQCSSTNGCYLTPIATRPDLSTHHYCLDCRKHTRYWPEGHTEGPVTALIFDRGTSSTVANWMRDRPSKISQSYDIHYPQGKTARSHKASYDQTSKQHVTSQIEDAVWDLSGSERLANKTSANIPTQPADPHRVRDRSQLAVCPSGQDSSNALPCRPRVGPRVNPTAWDRRHQVSIREIDQRLRVLRLQ
jgi:hypothetical protein